jgi:PAS domain S-box-containing protein
MSSTADAPATSLFEELDRSPVIATLLAQLPIGIAIASRDGRIEYMNEAATTLCDIRQLMHATPEPWLVTAAPPDELEPIRWIIARALLTGEVIRDEEVEYRDVEGEWRTLSTRATPVAEHVVVSFEDVTDRNRGREWEPPLR